MAEVVSMQDIEATAHRLGIDISLVDLDAIRLPHGEDFGIKSDDDEDLFQEDGLEFEGGFRNIIVVDNLPVVPPEKFEKLEGVIRKIYSQIGVIREGGLWMPVNPETKKTLGYCFIEYNTPQYMKVPDEWTSAEIKPYTPGENLQQWLTDEKARDQFVIRAGTFTEVFWNDPRQLMPDLVYRRQMNELGDSEVEDPEIVPHFDVQTYTYSLDDVEFTLTLKLYRRGDDFWVVPKCIATGPE